MGNLVRFAKEELDKIKKDSDGMQDAMNRHILEMVTLFEEEGHSGTSASYAIGVLERLLRFKTLVPLTGDDDEWNEVAVEDGIILEQNKRCGSVFRHSKDNTTAYDIDAKIFSRDKGETWFSCRASREKISFPYYPNIYPRKVLIAENFNFDELTKMEGKER